MMKYGLISFFLLFSSLAFSQGMNSHWLIGYNANPNDKGRIVFDSSSYLFTIENRPMQFWGTQATIADNNGNFLMSSNGVWIANALNDTMMNGSGLNPSWDVTAHPNGLLIFNGNVFLPFPGDSDKYLLVHEAKLGQFSIDPSRVYYSVIDITLDGGLGAVVQKNDTILEDTLSWGLAACKHANGRDWWVVAVHDGNPLVNKMLFTPDGLNSITTQQLNYTFNTWGNASQILFSQKGDKFMYNSGINQTQSGYVLIADFDRCNGSFFNEQIIPISSTNYVWGLVFSPSGEYAYASTSQRIFQINTTTLAVDTIATYDGFVSGFPPNCCATTFFNMYLAANGKIYITSGSSVQHIHEMNYPDSAGTACDLQQHNINLGIWNFRSVPNHPNYYLGPVAGSVCDSLTGLTPGPSPTGEGRFEILPNPNNGSFEIMYLLPQNKSGVFEVYDVNGRKVYEQNLPQWSTVQQINLSGGYSQRAPVTLKGSSAQIAEGIYQCVITSDGKRAVKKVVILKD